MATEVVENIVTDAIESVVENVVEEFVADEKHEEVVTNCLMRLLSLLYSVTFGYLLKLYYSKSTSSSAP